MLRLVLKSLRMITVDVCPSHMHIECVYFTLPLNPYLMRHSRDKVVDRELDTGKLRLTKNDVGTHNQVLTSKGLKLIATKQSLIKQI